MAFQQYKITVPEEHYSHVVQLILTVIKIQNVSDACLQKGFDTLHVLHQYQRHIEYKIVKVYCI